MTVDAFASALGLLGVALPLKVDKEYTGSIVDQNDMPVIQVDVNAAWLSDADADQAAALIVVAVNKAAGSPAPDFVGAHG